MNSLVPRQRVCFLPVAGIECPHQLLTMKGLAEDGRFEVRHGVNARFFPCMRTWLRDRPDRFYFDWIDRFHSGRNSLLTLVKSVTFCIDVLMATKILRRPVYWTVHNLHSHEGTASNRRELYMQKFFARHATRIRVFSNGAIGRVSARLGVEPAKLLALPEGSYMDYYPNEISPALARQKLNIPRDQLVLLWLGHIRPYKGLAELIEAFRQVARPNWRLIIAGKPYIEAYANEVAGQVRGNAQIAFYPRFIAEAELQVFFNAADAVVLPFTDIENSASLTMSMGFQKPVVAPNLGVIGERLRGQPELVYWPGGLAGTLEKLAAMPAARLAEIGLANAAEVQRHNWKEIAGLFQNRDERRQSFVA